MGARGSQLSRAVEFFRSANLDEARVAYILVKEVMEPRLRQAAVSKQRQSAALSMPRKTRTRKSTVVNAPVATGTAPTSGAAEAQAAVAGA